MEPLYLTTAIPFVNGAPHLGHALELVETDAIARHARLRGRPIRFLTGTDENAPKVAQAAAAAGVDVADVRDGELEPVRRPGRVAAGLVRRLHPHQHGPASRADRRGDLARVPRGGRPLPRAVRGLVLRGLRTVRRRGVRRARRAARVGRGGELVLPPVALRRAHPHADPQSRPLRIVPDARANEVLAFLDDGRRATSASRVRARGRAAGASRSRTIPNRSSTSGSTRSINYLSARAGSGAWSRRRSYGGT